MLKLALSYAMYYYETLNSVEFAMRILGETIAEAREEFYNFKRKASEIEIREYTEAMRTIDNNL